MARIKRGVYVSKDTYPTTEIKSAAAFLRPGSVVLEKDGFVGVVHTIYTDSDVSLCLPDYATRNDMVERDECTHISELRLIKF